MTNTDTLVALQKRVKELRDEIKREVVSAIQAGFAPIFADFPSVTSLAWEQDDAYYDDNDTSFNALIDEGPCFCINGIRGWEIESAKGRKTHNVDGKVGSDYLKAADKACDFLCALNKLDDTILATLTTGHVFVTVTRDGITIGK